MSNIKGSLGEAAFQFRSVHSFRQALSYSCESLLFVARLQELGFDRDLANSLEAEVAKERAAVRQLTEKVDEISSGLAGATWLPATRLLADLRQSFGCFAIWDIKTKGGLEFFKRKKGTAHPTVWADLTWVRFMGSDLSSCRLGLSIPGSRGTLQSQQSERCGSQAGERQGHQQCHSPGGGSWREAVPGGGGLRCYGQGSAGQGPAQEQGHHHSHQQGNALFQGQGTSDPALACEERFMMWLECLLAAIKA